MQVAAGTSLSAAMPRPPPTVATFVSGGQLGSYKVNFNNHKCFLSGSKLKRVLALQLSSLTLGTPRDARVGAPCFWFMKSYTSSNCKTNKLRDHVSCSWLHSSNGHAAYIRGIPLVYNEQ